MSLLCCNSKLQAQSLHISLIFFAPSLLSAVCTLPTKQATQPIQTLPAFLSPGAQDELGKLVLLDHVLSGTQLIAIFLVLGGGIIWWWKSSQRVVPAHATR